MANIIGRANETDAKVIREKMWKIIKYEGKKRTEDGGVGNIFIYLESEKWMSNEKGRKEIKVHAWMCLLSRCLAVVLYVRADMTRYS